MSETKKIIVQFDQDQAGSGSAEQGARYNFSEVHVLSRLNDVSLAKFTYPASSLHTFYKDGKPNIPSQVKLEFSGPASGDRVILFRGFTGEIEIDQSTFTLTFFDPIITLLQSDLPFAGENKTLQDVVQYYVDNSYESGDHQIIVETSLADLPPLKYASNNEKQTDLRYLQSLCRRYGLVFYMEYQPNGKDKLVFQKPDFKSMGGSEELKVDDSFTQILFFKSRLLNGIDEVTFSNEFKGEGGTKVMSVDSIGSSALFREKSNMKRKSGLKLSYFESDDLSDDETMSCLGEGQLIHSNLKNDIVSIATRKILTPGTSFTLGGSSSSIRSSLAHGDYLVDSLELYLGQDSPPEISVHGVRP